jgi:hypothetical protein
MVVSNFKGPPRQPAFIDPHVSHGSAASALRWRRGVAGATRKRCHGGAISQVRPPQLAPSFCYSSYNAPAELFLAKRTKRSRENYRRFATAAGAIRYAVETLRTKPSARRLRSGTNALTAAKSSACTKLAIIRCVSRSDRTVRAHEFATRLMGPSFSGVYRHRPHTPDFKISE